MSEDSFHTLSSADDWNEARSRSQEQPVLVFKHSNACPVSGNAKREMQDLVQEGSLPVYKLVVQESRALSDEIADTLDVRHETPQAILLIEGAPAFHTSHFDVTADTVREALPSDPVSSE